MCAEQSAIQFLKYFKCTLCLDIELLLKDIIRIVRAYIVAYIIFHSIIIPILSHCHTIDM